jgi:thiamine biosynthesis lipoprotein
VKEESERYPSPNPLPQGARGIKLPSLEGRDKGRVNIFILILFLTSLLLFSCSNKERIYKKSRISMDTIVAITVVSGSEDRADRAIDAAFSRIDALDKTLNFFSDTSELSRINAEAGSAPVAVSPETVEVIAKAIDTSAKTEGAFDVTVGPEIALWDFVAKKMPDEKTVKERLPLVNYRNMVVDREKSTVFLAKGGMRADLGAIAKGYAADRAVEELKRQGIRAGLVAVAGDIRAFGLKPDGSGWKVGIRDPRAGGKADEILATVELRDMAVSTSGDYERYFIKDGIRYHHILDPKTGYPAAGCRSVTVLAKEGADTDSFSTGIFVLGPEKGMKVLERMGFEGMIIDKDGRVFTTPGLKERIEFKGKH